MAARPPSASNVALRSDKDFDLAEWIRLFKASDYNEWWEQRHAEAARAHRYLVVTAWEDDSMVGTASVESDGVNSAFLDDVVVHPSYRKLGIGSMMVREALARLRPLKLTHIQLQAIPGRESFFERFGFVVQTGASVMDLEGP